MFRLSRCVYLGDVLLSLELVIAIIKRRVKFRIGLQNLLLAASLGVIATLPVLVSYIPGLTGINDVTLQIGGMGSVLIITGGVSGLLGLISGAGYLISLNRFDR